MRITEFVTVDHVIPSLAAGPAAEVLGSLVGPLVASGELRSADGAVEALLAREALGSTGIGEGVALPHAKLRGIEGLSIVVGRCPEGAAFDASDGKPVTLFFLILAPEHSSGMHLKALAKISRMVRDRETRRRLLAAADAAEIHAILKRSDEAF